MNSRGETSRAILDCLAHGLTCIVNAHSSATEIPRDCIISLPEHPTATDMTASLRDIFEDRTRADAIGARGRALIERDHGPDTVSERMSNIIETSYRTSPLAREGRILRQAAKLCERIEHVQSDVDGFSISLACNQPRVGTRQLLCDVSVLAQTGGNTGIQRVVRNILRMLLANPPKGWRVEPVIVSEHVIYARRFLAEHFGLATFDVADEGVDARQGDVFLALDWSPDRLPQASHWLKTFRQLGGRVVSVVYDLLPLESPEFFPPWMHMFMWNWFKCIALHSDSIACISAVVADDVRRYQAAVMLSDAGSAPVRSFELGADFAESAREQRSPGMNDLASAPGLTFVMVGTVEPRKGHAQMLRVFHALWKQDANVNLVIVGKLGWMSDDVGATIRASPEHERRLFWFENANDLLLNGIYAEADALVAASYGEGFGLPLIEAAMKNVHVIARDIPVFREVCGSHAFFFADGDDDAITAAMTTWLDLFSRGKAPSPRGMRHVDWAESARQLLAITLDEVDLLCREDAEREVVQ